MLREPYKFLDAYTKDDRDIFFGREAEIEEIHSRLFMSKLLLIYGASGTGKSSLLQCGVANRFSDADWKPIFIRRKEHLLDALHHELARTASTPFKKQSSISQKLESVYLDYLTPVHLIFDQIEELFIFGDHSEQEEFVRELAEILSGHSNVRVILCIREEYLAHLSAFEDRLPSLFNNRIRIEKFSRTHALSAIEGPCRVCGVKIEPGLAETAAQKLTSAAGVIELTYLQVLMDRVYKLAVSRDPVSIHLTLNDLGRIGDIGNLLSDFLEKQLSAMDHPDQGEALLKIMVTTEGTRRPVRPVEIAAHLETMGKPFSEERITSIIQHFVNVRIITDQDEQGYYELRHDSLAKRIYERMTALEKDILEVRQMLEGRHREYERRGVLLDAATLDYIAPYKNRLKFRSAIAGFIEKSLKATTARRKRIRTALGMAVAIFMIVVSTLGIYGYVKSIEAENQRERAEAERNRAVAQKNLALEAIQKLTYDVPHKLANVPGILSILIGIQKENVQLLDRILDLNPDTPDAQREKAVNLNLIGDRWFLLSDTAAAQQAYQEAFNIREKLADRYPDSIEAQRDLADSNNKLGYLYFRIGDTDTAQKLYQNAAKIGGLIGGLMGEALAGKDIPTQRALSLSIERLGDLHIVQGNTSAAKEAYQKAFEITRKLAVKYPDSQEIQRDLSLRFERLGDLDFRLGATDAAQVEYQKALDVNRKLAEKDPNSLLAQRHLWGSYIRLSDLNIRLGNTTVAEGACQKAFEIIRKLAVKYPDNQQIQRELSLSFKCLGDLNVGLGDTALAESYYKKAFEISRKLAEKGLNNQQSQRDLWGSYIKLGDLDLVRGNTSAAKEAYQKAFEITRKLAVKDPDNQEIQRDLSLSFDRLGDLQLLLVDTANSEEAYQKAFEIARKLAVMDPDNQQAQKDLAISYIKFGDLYISLGYTSTAQEYYQKAFEIIRKLAAMDSANHKTERDLSARLESLGGILLRLGYTSVAQRAYYKAFEISLKLAEKDPDSQKSQRKLLAHLEKLGGLLLGMDNTARTQEIIKWAWKLARDWPKRIRLTKKPNETYR
jgi:tetratricopeptide (TPR) repeat protein